jgi:hypothetical protein
VERSRETPAPRDGRAASTDDRVRASQAVRRYPSGAEGARVAVPRGSRPPSAIPGWGWYDRRVYAPSYWYRHYYRPSAWYWAPGIGLGYWSYYDPWYAGPYWYGGGAYRYSTYDELGAVRLKMRPREAQVLVDGYVAGVVDEFDGAFQRLRLEEGPHEIEVRLPGYQPQFFRVYVTRDRTVTLQGDLLPLP